MHLNNKNKIQLHLFNAKINLIITFMLIFISLIIFYKPTLHTIAPTPPIYIGDTNKSQISLMINVYWGQEYIDDILNALQTFKVPATFFFGNQFVVKSPDFVKKIYEMGHEIANHGSKHLSHDKLSYEENVTEILKCHNSIKTLLNIDMNLFAPPSGAFNDNTLIAAKNNGYHTIMWTRDTIDWRDKDYELIFSRATNKIKNGSLILMHPTLNTAKALPKILTHYEKNNISVVTVSQNCNL